MKKLSGKERFALTARILIGIILLWIIMRSGIVGSIMYWAGLEKGHIKIDIQEVYDMKKMPYGGYFPTLQVSSAKGKTILVTATRGKVLNVTKCQKRMQATKCQERMQAGEKIMPLRFYAFSNGNASFRLSTINAPVSSVFVTFFPLTRYILSLYFLTENLRRSKTTPYFCTVT